MKNGVAVYADPSFGYHKSTDAYGNQASQRCDPRACVSGLAYVQLANMMGLLDASVGGSPEGEAQCRTLVAASAPTTASAVTRSGTQTSFRPRAVLPRSGTIPATRTEPTRPPPLSSEPDPPRRVGRPGCHHVADTVPRRGGWETRDVNETGRQQSGRSDPHRCTITSSRSAGGYLAMPDSRPRATIAVLHAWWGLTQVVTGVCDDLAALGYAAIAPDLYAGQLAATAEEAAALRARKRGTPMWRQIVGEVNRVRADHGVDAVGQIGFSMGGHWALWLAKQTRPEIPPISATTVFYATRAGDFSGSRSAFQFHLAETDSFVSPGSVLRQERQLRAAGCDIEFHRYPGTGHWFFEWDRLDAYDRHAADLAWGRTVDFLDRHLPESTTRP